MRRRIVVALSGASGVPLATEFLTYSKNLPQWETHLIVSAGFKKTLEAETDLTVSDMYDMATTVYDNDDLGASISSGTFETAGMVIIPCSMKTVAGIACGFSNSLILRTADVTIKERRKLVLVARETPLSPIHLKNMLYLAQLGVVIMPPMLTYYNGPQEILHMTRHIVGKVLSEFGVEMDGYKRWK